MLLQELDHLITNLEDAKARLERLFVVTQGDIPLKVRGGLVDKVESIGRCIESLDNQATIHLCRVEFNALKKHTKCA